LIQVGRGPGTNVEVLPLTVVNLMQRSGSKTDVCNGDSAMKHAIGKLNAENGSSPWYTEYDSNEDSDRGYRLKVSPNLGTSS